MNTPTNNESKKYYDYTGKGNVDLEAQNQNMNDSWTEEFISRFFVSRLNDNTGKAPHVGAQHDAVTYISSLLESARSDERKKVLKELMSTVPHKVANTISIGDSDYIRGENRCLVEFCCKLEDFVKSKNVDLLE